MGVPALPMPSGGIRRTKPPTHFFYNSLFMLRKISDRLLCPSICPGKPARVHSCRSCMLPSERVELISSAAQDIEVDFALDAVDMPGIMVLPQHPIVIFGRPPQ
jgi:hypothetical protein